MNVLETKFSVLYNNKNITSDISKYLIAITYNDKTEGESDDMEIELEDVDALWQNSWYPEKGASISLTIGRLKCGVFEIDEIEVKGPPSTVTIKGAAVGIKSSLRTKKSDAHENKTLKQIAEKVAQKNGLTISGTVPDITIGRITQNKETDLGFLKRISKDYGIVFSVRGQNMTFLSVYDLESRKVSFVVDVTDLTGYSLKDKTDAPKTSKAIHASAKGNGKIESNLEFEAYKKEQGYSAPATKSGNDSVTYSKAENKKQAEAKAKAVMHTSSMNQFSGRVEIGGDNANVDLAVAGNNFQLNGVGILSGKYHIIASSHKLDKSGARTMEAEIKRLNLPAKNQQITTKKKKQQPKSVKVVKSSLDYNKNIFGHYDPFNNPIRKI